MEETKLLFDAVETTAEESELLENGLAIGVDAHGL